MEVAIQGKTRCVAMPSLMAARWAGQNSSAFFRRLWIKVRRIKFACAGVSVVCNAVFTASLKITLIILEGARENAYLRQALAFNAEKFRGPRDLGYAPFWKNFWGSCPDCPWEHLCQISSP